MVPLKRGLSITPIQLELQVDFGPKDLPEFAEPQKNIVKKLITYMSFVITLLPAYPLDSRNSTQYFLGFYCVEWTCQQPPNHGRKAIVPLSTFRE